MSRLLAVIGAVAALTPYAACADPSPVEKAFGNTIVSTYPDGRRAELWLQAGGNYTAEGRRGDTSSGHWRVKGNRLCLHQSRPVPVPFTYCTPIPAEGMGAAWTAKAATGERIRVALVRGHRAGAPARGA